MFLPHTQASGNSGYWLGRSAFTCFSYNKPDDYFGRYQDLFGNLPPATAPKLACRYSSLRPRDGTRTSTRLAPVARDSSVPTHSSRLVKDKDTTSGSLTRQREKPSEGGRPTSDAFPWLEEANRRLPRVHNTRYSYRFQWGGEKVPPEEEWSNTPPPKLGPEAVEQIRQHAQLPVYRPHVSLRRNDPYYDARRPVSVQPKETRPPRDKLHRLIVQNPVKLNAEASVVDVPYRIVGHHF
ncbi:unnamed protein product [Vitrella brassicaformis CCMP3155]|uniref:Uncharacterized protein n=1 Tax=Vitrella brassicaformis (strain CCMP3155) TaxID=1169540 RepID=A0A0G4ECM4_VITBC|nr:unnamed protein product [Vitrella brassicaformis CCMP3155]|eukprot:CEL93724.1 unnamed protein product [Vitrella brassicaformis CCMP3155]